MTTPTLLLAGLRATGMRPSTTAVPSRSHTAVLVAARLAVVAAFVVVVVSIPAIPTAADSTLGLLVGVPGLAVAFGLSGLAVVLAVRAGSVVDAWVATIVSVLVMRLPIALGTGAPLYSWTYKHLGVIDWIQHHGHVATGVDIYAGWPGVFAAIAWFASATGISPVSIAQWFEVGADIALVGAVGALARSLGTSKLSAVTAAFIAGVANWVGQDYMSPQAVSFLLGIVVVTLLVRSRTRPVFGWLSLPVFAAIAVSHQLTPYWLLAVAAGFAVLGAVRPRLVVVLFGVLAGAMVLLNLHLVQEYMTGEAFDPLANAQTSGAGGSGSVGMTVTALAARVVSLAVWGSAGVLVLVGLRWDRIGGSRVRRWTTLRLAVVAFAPFGLLAGQSYGGEAIYRVFLYSVPGCAVLIAPVLVRCIRAGLGRHPHQPGGPTHPVRTTAATVGGRLALAGTAVVVVGLTLASGQAVYGAWFSDLVSPAELAVSTQLLNTAPVPSEILTPAPVGPGRNTEQYVLQARADQQYDASITSWKGWAGQSYRDPAVEQKLTTALQGDGHPVYMMITQQMIDWNEYNGAAPAGSIQRLERQVSTDPRWMSVVAAPGVEVYRLTGTSVVAGR